ncbi:RodZ domain-containing protein [Halioxenophilus sp. WMMB6]|uniref:RodZ domain-containing protein n=1 Tax=Halioxenophilus sp. WMMB6 TaxID=3073815 RepID=UPI00295F2912|nr:RodZ domain-containing protein [Halioxenophilus sp. WMMB6]
MTDTAMNPSPPADTDPSESNATPTITPGQMLQDARQKMGFELADVAREINLPVKKLTALEQNQFDRLSSPTFIKGYLRSYCRYLQIDADAVIACYDNYVSELSQAGVTVTRPTQRMKPLEKPFPEWNWAILVGAVLFVALAGFFLWGGGKDAESPAVARQTVETAPAEPALDTSPATNELPGAVAASDESVSSAVATEPPQTELTAAQLIAPAVAEQAPEVAAEPTSDTLEFSFSEECWVEVKDATGMPLHQGVSQAGDKLSIVGTAPFSIMLGNVRAATLELNGEPVKIQPVPGRNTLRFEVGEEP